MDNNVMISYLRIESNDAMPRKFMSELLYSVIYF